MTKFLSIIALLSAIGFNIFATDITPAKMNINTANSSALLTLKRLGKTRAEAIIAYRQQHGPFKSLDELTRVKGITQNYLAKNRDRLVLN